MKSSRFCLLYCFIMLSTICYAQKTQIADSVFFKISEKFAGTWKWTSDTAEFIIHLEKPKPLRPDQFQARALIGVHSFKKNGVMIENYLEHFSSLDFKSVTIFVMAKYDGTNPDEVDGTIQDKQKDKSDYLSLVFNNTTIPSITLYLNNIGDPKDTKRKKALADPTFSFPSRVVLVKQ